MPASSPDPRHLAAPPPPLPSSSRRPTTRHLERCLAALEAGTALPDELIVQREPAGSGPAAARNLGAAASDGRRPRLRRLRRRGPRRRAGPDREPLPGRPRSRRRLRRLRRRPRRPWPHLALPQPPPPPRPHRRRRERRRPSGRAWARSGARPSKAAGGFDADEYPQAERRGHRAGNAPAATGGDDPPRPGDPRPPPQGAGRPRSMVRTDFGRRGVPWARLLLRDGSGSTALNLGWRRRPSAATSVALLASLLARCPRAAAAAPPRQPRSSTATSTRSSPAAAARGCCSPGSACTSCTSSPPPPRCPSPLPSTSPRGAAMRLGIAGCGRIAERGYVPAALAAEGVTIAGFADPDAGRRRHCAALWARGGNNEASAFSSATQLLATEPIDLLVIAAPVAHHLALAEEAAGAGVRSLVEKPPAPDLAAARAAGGAGPAAAPRLQPPLPPGPRAARPDPRRGLARARPGAALPPRRLGRAPGGRRGAPRRRHPPDRPRLPPHRIRPDRRAPS